MDNISSSISEEYINEVENGSADEQFNLAIRYYNGNEVTQDYIKVVYWLTKAAEQGHVVAQYNLGFFYSNGEGVIKDYTKAVYWYAKAAEQGHTEAQNSLGVCYSNGKGVAQDDSKAVYWYEKSAEQGCANAQYNLGGCYKNGEGVAQDASKAVYWYTKAAEQGNANAQENLDRCSKETNAVAHNNASEVDVAGESNTDGVYTINCPNCGAQNSDTGAFCAKCGQNLTETAKNMKGEFGTHMKDTYNEMRHLTTWEAIGSKPVAFLLTTVALFIVQTIIVYPIIVVLLAIVASSFVTTMMENSPIKMIFQNSLIIMMALISVLLAVRLTKLFSKKVPAVFSSEEEEKAHFMNIGKWKKIYAKILGCFLFFVSIFIVMLIDEFMRSSNTAMVVLLGFVLSIVFSVLFVKFFNRHMMKVTRTNFYLLEEVRMGLHNAEIPDDFYDDKGFNKIIRILQNGEAHTVGGAVAVLMRRGRIMRIAVMGGILAAVLGWSAGSAIGNSISGQIKDSVGGGLAGGKGTGSRKSPSNAVGGSSGKGYDYFYRQYKYRFFQKPSIQARLAEHNSNDADRAYNQVVFEWNNRNKN